MSRTEHGKPAPIRPAALDRAALNAAAPASEAPTVFVEVEVVLLDAEGEVVATTVTDRDGHYWFTDLEPEAHYSVVITGPTGFDSRAIDFTAPAAVAGATQNRAGAGLADDITLDVALRPMKPKKAKKPPKTA